MAVKDQTYVPSELYAPIGEPNRKVSVVYYSRSGHSEAAAREIARSFNAPIARVDADYPRDFSGQRKAVSDAIAQALPAVRVGPIDLAPARRVFLVSPTWMFRPAPPLWAYVERAPLTGKQVVLVMTGNSRFEQSEIDAFAKRIEAHGGRLVRHIFLRRGRIYWQKSREELIQEVRAKISAFQA
jgi:flavodoxin